MTHQPTDNLIYAKISMSNDTGVCQHSCRNFYF